MQRGPDRVRTGVRRGPRRGRGRACARAKPDRAGLHRAPQPRRGFAGTYDEAWRSERWPGLPEDFDYRFHNSAPTSLQNRGYFCGDETLRLEGLTAQANAEYRLPGITVFGIATNARGEGGAIHLRLDTIAINTDDSTIRLFWRGALPADADVDLLTLISRPLEGP